MAGYLGRRLLTAVPVVLGVSVLVFLSVHLLPGDPVQALMGGAVVDKAQLDLLRQQLGLNDPLPVQYARFLTAALRGDLGRSLQTRQPVMAAILAQAPATVELTLAAMAFAVVVGMTLGTIAALRHNTWIDALAMLVALAGVSMPSFWLGMLLILTFSLALGLLPATGTEGVQRLLMPAFTLGYGAAAIIARLTRSSMLEVISQEYVTSARAKGLRESAVILRHALRNALIPVITIIGLQFGNLLAGTVVVETVFTRQGIGRLLIDAILGRDFPVIQGTILFVATAYVFINLAVDLFYAAIDPRIRYQ